MIYIKTRRAMLAVFAALATWAIGASAQDQPQPKLPTITLGAGMHLIQAEVAATLRQQMTGMMFRRQMGSNEGMLFVYDEPAPRCFWMRNTYLPLTIAFVADDGRIVNLADMQPLNDASHCSAEPVRFALEMNQGWFAKRGIGPGFKLRGPPFGN
jgi:uncharacterized membrane protein (UPF0127 family)